MDPKLRKTHTWPPKWVQGHLPGRGLENTWKMRATRSTQDLKQNSWEGLVNTPRAPSDLSKFDIHCWCYLTLALGALGKHKHRIIWKYWS